MKNNNNLLFAVMFSICSLVGCGEPDINSTHVNFKESAAELPAVEPIIPSDYFIGRGDELEVFYYIDPDSSLSEYVIDTEDTLRIEFYYYPALNKTARVRPDGFITLSRVGDVKVVDMTPTVLTEKIMELYKPFLKRPTVTVEAVNFNVKLENLKAAVQTTSRGQSRQVTVRPDGKISLPYIDDITANNLTCMKLSRTIEQKYRRFVKNVSITTSVLNAHSNRAYIIGEIAKSDFYELPGAITLTQLVSQAGGFTLRANTHQIVLIRRSKDGQPDARLVDMDKIIGRGDITSDPIIRQYDVIFVPKTKISQAALVMNSIMSLIPARFSASYSLGGQDVE